MRDLTTSKGVFRAVPVGDGRGRAMERVAETASVVRASVEREFERREVGRERRE